MKKILFILIVPSLLMAGLGVYWLKLTSELDGQRAEFLEMPAIRNHQQSIAGLLNGQTQATAEKYKDALIKQQTMVKWERSFYEMLRHNMVYLGWIAYFIALCQVAGVYYIHNRIRGTRTQ
jgi:hypothetical protein